MILTNGEIVNLYEGLQKLREGRSSALPIAAGFAIIKNMKTIEPLYSAIIDARTEIIQKNGEKSEQGIVIPPSKIESVNSLLNELSKIQNEVALDIISLETLQEQQFTLEEIDILYPMIGETV